MIALRFGARGQSKRSCDQSENTRRLLSKLSVESRMQDLPFQNESLSNDPIHGYIPFTSCEGIPAGEVAEQQIIDHPWVQRLRQIHQLQTAWWVFPSAEHTRFQHVLGAMHLASRAIDRLYPSLQATCEGLPSRAYVESLMRMAALLHDVGHGPFGHFFDQHFLADYGLTHETLGTEIIRRELGELLRGIRRNPRGQLNDGESLDPEQIAYLIVRPRSADEEDGPQWLRWLRALFAGLYTVDNMDFVLRDAYMAGYSARSFDLARLLHYSFFSDRGLTVHSRGLAALVRFISVRAELFRSIYFHRTVRAIDLDLEDLFRRSKSRLFPGNPLDHLDAYRRFTEWALLVEVAGWSYNEDPEVRELGQAWERFLNRQIHWTMICEREVFFGPDQAEGAHVLSDSRLFEAALRPHLPEAIRDMPLRIDAPRHGQRPGAHAPTAGLNYLFDPASGKIRRLDARELFRQLPLSYRICRVYAREDRHDAEVAAAVDAVLGASVIDDVTNL